MNNKLSQIFKSVSQVEPPKELSGLIFRRIEREKEKKIKRNLLWSYVGLTSSFSIAFIIILTFGSALAKSDFWSIFSLIFSDALVVAGNWQEYGYSLLETLPMINVIIFLTPIFVFLLFLNLLFSFRNEYKQSRNHLKFA